MSRSEAEGAQVAFARHTLATLAYRAGKVLRDVPAGFGDLRVSPGMRTPTELVSHIADLMEWGQRMAGGESRWEPGETTDWEGSVDRFYQGVAAFDSSLEQWQPGRYSLQPVFQGPIADALTHVGQLALLRRVADTPVRPENYAKAEITVGIVGPAQAEPRREFDADASWPDRES